MLGRGGSWVGNTVAGLTLGRVWLYQDFVAGSGPGITLTDNDNGSGLVFDANLVVDSSAVVTKDTGEPIFTNTAELPSQIVKVSTHTDDAVLLNGTPAVGEGVVRVWYLYAMPATDFPSDAELAPFFVREARSEFLDVRFLNATLNLSDLANAATSRTNLGFTTNAAGRVLFGDGTSVPVSDADLFWDNSNNRLGVNQGAPGAAATLDVGGITGGIGLPVVTTTERDALTPARNGVILYNSTVHRIDGYINGAWGPVGITDHGNLTGLADDDHTQYALLLGRAGGQALIGGTAASNGLTLTSTSHGTKGKVSIGGTLTVDEVNSRVGISIVSPTYKLHHEAILDDYSHGFALSHALGGANSLWRLYPDLNGTFGIANPAQTTVLLTCSHLGVVSLAGGLGTFGGTVNIRNQTSVTNLHTVVICQNAGQTGDLLRFVDDDTTTVLAKVTEAGAATFVGLTISAFTTAGFLVTNTSGVISRVTGTSGQAIYHDGTNWAASNRKEKAGKVDIASGATTKAIVFATARADALYTPIFTMFNSVDADPIGIPTRIIAIANTGFTAEWDDMLPTADYDGYWGILEHYDP